LISNFISYFTEKGIGQLHLRNLIRTDNAKYDYLLELGIVEMPDKLTLEQKYDLMR
jgi:hypothetical protein